MAAHPLLVGGHRLTRSGELWMVGCIVGYVASYLFDRVAVAHVDPLIGPLFRRLPSLLMGVILIFVQQTAAQLNPSSEKFVGRTTIGIFLISGVLQTFGAFSYYYALRFGGVTLTAPITQTLVLWGAIAGWVYLGERFSPKGLMGIAIVSIGIMLLSYGQSRGVAVSEQWVYAVPLALVSAMTWGIGGVLWRDGQLRGAHQSTSIFLQFSSSIFLTILVLALMGRLEAIAEASGRDLLILSGSGILSGIIGVYCMFMALRLMSVARVYTLYSLVTIVSVVLAYVVLGEYINRVMLIGILLTCFGVVLVQRFKPARERVA